MLRNHSGGPLFRGQVKPNSWYGCRAAVATPGLLVLLLTLFLLRLNLKNFQREEILTKWK